MRFQGQYTSALLGHFGGDAFLRYLQEKHELIHTLATRYA